MDNADGAPMTFEQTHSELLEAIDELGFFLGEIKRYYGTDVEVPDELHVHVQRAAVKIVEWWSGEDFTHEPITLEAIAALFSGQ